MFCITAYAQTNNYSNNISADYCVALDKDTKTVLYEKNANVKTSMASTTKIMTCLIASYEADLMQTVVVTDEMLSGTEGSLIYLNPGDSITVYDLMKGALLASGNDAANVLAFVVSGSIKEFVNLMNCYARDFGMENTSFVTPSGLDGKKHYSTAFDMALLTARALQDETFSSICKMQSATITINGKKQKIYNHNKLLSTVENCIGVKTGYTKKSGRCLVSAFEYKGSTIIIVTLSAPDDWQDHKKILEFSKKKYRLSCKTQYFDISTVGSDCDSIRCEASYDVAYLSSLETKAYYYPFIYAPTLPNSKIGILKIYSNNVCIGTVDIIVPESVKVWQTTK